MYIDMCYVEFLNSIIATCDRIQDCTLFKIFTNDCNDRSGYICSFSNKLSYCHFLDSNTA